MSGGLIALLRLKTLRRTQVAFAQLKVTIFAVFSAWASWAGNRLEDRASIFEMAAPLKNRFGHAQLKEPTVEAWTRWAVDHNIDMRIVGFLNFRRTALFQFDPRLKENAFPTPRSWEHVSNLISDMSSDQLQVIQQIVSTQVGVGMAGEFAT